MREHAKFVLLVVDMLNDFFDEHPTLFAQRTNLVSAINGVARAFRRYRQPIIWIRQEFAPDLSDGFLEMRKQNVRVTIAGTDGCEILAELHREPAEKVIVKKRYSAFFGTDLDTILEAMGTETLVVAGINTHACVRMTVIDAYQRDYEVLVVSDGIASYDAAHHDVTCRYLEGSIARFVSSDKIAEMVGGLEDGV